MDLISRINKLFKDDIDQMNNLIKDLTYKHHKLIYLISDHLISSGGKRLRPILTLICAKLLGYQGREHIKLATSIEFIHAATLLHDDVVDESMLRRGVDTANKIWGNKASILVGDFLLSQAFKLMVEHGSLEILNILSSASAIIAEGEVMQLAAISDLNTNYEKYLKIIESKTAELFAASCQIGAIVAEGTLDQQNLLRSFGMNLGIAFQIIDDSLDYFADEKITGKSLGNDFAEAKITLPVILAYNMGTEEEKAFWQNTMQDAENNAQDLMKANMIFEKYDIQSIVYEHANKYINSAKDSMEVFQESEIKTLLLEILDFAIKRLY